MTPPPLEIVLQTQKAALFKEIVGFGATDEDRRKLRRLLEELDTIQRALTAAAEDPNSKRYVTARKPIEAIVQFLEDKKEPQTKEDIIKGVLAGGWRGGGREQMQWLSISMEVFLSPTATGARGKRSPLKRRLDRIGLKEWEDARWE